jgi:hypothetical protein
MLLMIYYQRDRATGATIPASSYSPIPEPVRGKFQHNYGHEVPMCVHYWSWSTTFGRWSALVTFYDGWTGYTYPLTYGN